ncbi:hypothetical protein EXIGLDRAFT_764503 [Exidia glandulosa HHB12029]|uniref:Uncharacterized protein n=1 Tax=Exidia glandulosa HHB12029 TaxID=1314781 RepID=A0A166B2Q5_EXIGL|nr:hypothetical protein EXIGLDRAFT_764503 [Exidia glandulosa HHB12029]
MHATGVRSLFPLAVAVALVGSTFPVSVSAYNAADLFPIPVEASWTTSLAATGLPDGVVKIALDDKAVNLTKDAGGQPHDLVDAPGSGVDGKVWRAFYPK